MALKSSQVTLTNTREYKLAHGDMLTKAGIFLSIDTNFTTVYSVVGHINFYETLAGQAMPIAGTGEDPAAYSRRLIQWKQGLFQIAGTQETGQAPTQAQMQFRRRLRNEPLLNGLSIATGTDNIDIYTNDRVPPFAVRTETRSRGFNEVPIGFLLPICAMFVSRNEMARNFFNSYAGPDVHIPLVFSEYMKSHRISRTQGMRIVPQFQNPWNARIHAILGTTNTILDFDFMQTQQGIGRLFELFSLLRADKDNYITFVPFENAISFDSGYTTTTMSWSCTTLVAADSTQSFNTVDQAGNVLVTPQVLTFTGSVDIVNLLPDHSYGTELNGTHLTDSIVFIQQLRDNVPNVINLAQFSSEYKPKFNNTDSVRFLVLRGIGEIHNRRGKYKSSNSQQRNTDSENVSVETASIAPEAQASTNSQTNSGRGKARPNSGTTTASGITFKSLARLASLAQRFQREFNLVFRSKAGNKKYLRNYSIAF